MVGERESETGKERKAVTGVLASQLVEEKLKVSLLSP